MTLKKEAKELVEKMYYAGIDKEKCHNPIYVITMKKAKKLALICVDVVISSGLILIDYREYKGDKRSCLNYWQEMKIEIDKL